MLPELRTFYDPDLHLKMEPGLEAYKDLPSLETGSNSPALRSLLADRLIGDGFRDGKYVIKDLIEFYSRFVRQEDVLMDWEDKVPVVESVVTAGMVKRGQRFSHSQGFDDYPSALSALTTFGRTPEDIVKCGRKFYVKANLVRR